MAITNQMEISIIVAIIAAAAAIAVPAISFYLTKSKERQADWQRYKFELYKELILSFSGIVGFNARGGPSFRRCLQYGSPDCFKRGFGGSTRISG